MNEDRPWAEWTYMVVGTVAWLVVTLVVAVAALITTGDHVGSALFLVVSWVALFALIGAARLVGSIGDRTMR